MTDSEPRPNPSLLRKHAARLAAVQCIYARMVYEKLRKDTMLDWQSEQTGADALFPVKPDKKLMQAVFLGVEEMRTALDEHGERILQDRWRGKRMPKVMRAIFLAALYELIYTPKLKPYVVLNEYVGVADAFLDDNDIGFVNGALQEIVNDLRPGEMRQREIVAREPKVTTARKAVAPLISVKKGDIVKKAHVTNANTLTIKKATITENNAVDSSHDKQDAINPDEDKAVASGNADDSIPSGTLVDNQANAEVLAPELTSEMNIPDDSATREADHLQQETAPKEA